MSNYIFVFYIQYTVVLFLSIPDPTMQKRRARENGHWDCILLLFFFAIYYFSTGTVFPGTVRRRTSLHKKLISKHENFETEGKPKHSNGDLNSKH